jgi:hypothetical protein
VGGAHRDGATRNAGSSLTASVPDCTVQYCSSTARAATGGMHPTAGLIRRQQQLIRPLKKMSHAMAGACVPSPKNASVALPLLWQQRQQAVIRICWARKPRSLCSVMCLTYHAGNCTDWQLCCTVPGSLALRAVQSSAAEQRDFYKHGMQSLSPGEQGISIGLTSCCLSWGHCHKHHTACMLL